MTLIEILVAVTLLGLLAAGIVTALQIAASSWQSARSRLTLDRRIATANAILHSEFSNIAPVEAEIPPERELGLQRLLFFQGEPESMRFVGSYSVTEGARGGLLLVELQIVDGRRGRRILLNQFPYLGPWSAGALVEGFIRFSDRPGGRVVYRPIRPMPTSLIIADELRQCSFAYLRRPLRPDEPTVWVQQWDELRRLPEAIAVNLTPQSGQARLLPVSIVTPVRAQEVVR